jgi:hypothetical protein
MIRKKRAIIEEKYVCARKIKEYERKYSIFYF